MGMKTTAGMLTLNDFAFDKSPIIPIYGDEDYAVDEAELQKSIERNREILISHGHGNLFEPDSILSK